jgi:2Fe-2S ferredoxin
MAAITIIGFDGTTRTFEARPDRNLMEEATRCGVQGIVGECGGNCACGTCRFYPAPEWRERLGEMSVIEREMLEFTEDSEPGARLACRIVVGEDMDGLCARLPGSQYSG